MLINNGKNPKYDEFMLRNGGQYNSYCTLDSTNFHFGINSKAFDEGIKLFSKSFIKPNFKVNRKEYVNDLIQ